MTRRAVFGVAVAAVLGAGACRSTESCRSGTAFVTIDVGPAGARANELEVRVLVDGAEVSRGTLVHPAGQRQGTVEVRFGGAYRQGATAVIEVQARLNGLTVATGSAEKRLEAGCSALSLTLEGEEAGDGAAPPDAPPPGDGPIADLPGPRVDGPAVVDGPGTTPDTQLVCPGGQHVCSGRCADDKDVVSCGGSCTPCRVPAGGMATCDGTMCGIACPGQQACLGACIPSGQPCSGVCPAGKHACGNECASDTEVNSCGTRCTPCAAPANGMAVCTGGQCGITCNSGHHPCGTACARNTDPATCGAMCTACPAPTGGQATCDGMTCGKSCPAGKWLCANACIDRSQPCSGQCPTGLNNCTGVCKDPSSPASCGPTCELCAAPTGGSVTCDGTHCQPACPGTLRLCNGACKDPGSINSCGPMCVQCTVTGDRQVPTCNGTTCGASCKDNAPRCSDNSCSRLLWSFDSGMTDGILPRVGPLDVRTFNGSPALAIDIAQLSEVSFRIPLCLSGNADLRGKTLSVRVFFEGTPTGPGQLYLQGSVPDPASGGFIGQASAGSGEWATYSQPISNSMFAGTAVEATFQAGTLGAPFAGTVWFDDIKIQ
jgi:hypothetical protein